MMQGGEIRERKSPEKACSSSPRLAQQQAEAAAECMQQLEMEEINCIYLELVSN